MVRYEVVGDAYIKVMLHAFHHPGRDVVGVLLGSRGAGGDVVRVAECIPLFHGSLTSAPLVGVALRQVAAHAAESGWDLVGVSFAAARPSGGRGAVVPGVLDAVAANFGDAACLLEVDGARMGEDGGRALAVDLRTSRTWGGGGGGEGAEREDDGDDAGPSDRLVLLEEEATLRRLAQLVGQGKQATLVDYEDHLEHLALDFRNPHLSERVA